MNQTVTASAQRNRLQAVPAGDIPATRRGPTTERLPRRRTFLFDPDVTSTAAIGLA
jgi:hypothetical protein